MSRFPVRRGELDLTCFDKVFPKPKDPFSPASPYLCHSDYVPDNSGDCVADGSLLVSRVLPQGRGETKLDESSLRALH